MRTAQDMFDVMPLGELLRLLPYLPDGEGVFLEDIHDPDPNTLAVVSGDARSPKEIRDELGFEHWVECDTARHALHDAGLSAERSSPEELIEGIEQGIL
jgi:hypothetical protein